jgi:hypothetical protein
VPIWKRYRGRYSSYVPLDRLSNHTTSFRQYARSALAGLFLPSSWRSEYERSRRTADARDEPNEEEWDEEGEELFQVDDNRREALSLDARRINDDGRRLSRDLEEGFKDDSDDEDETDSRSIRVPTL